MRIQKHIKNVTGALLIATVSSSAFAGFGQWLHDQAQSIRAANMQSYGLAQPAEQTIDLSQGASQKQWVMIDQSIASDGSSFSFAPKGQDMSDWSELIRTTTIPYDSMSGISARKLFKLEADDAREQCSRVDAKILKKSSNSITYKINVSGCSGSADQYQIGKAFNGDDAVYNVMYSAMKKDVSKHSFNKTANRIESARLIANPAAE